ncbi:25S rRNA (adenine2142-N1)-methyltransferase [Coemansia nantahalensis]|uniref:25S rRNA (Adenine2142-N1)-methyltransferase n=1 Tax=Coemansia nantahalensis TaxID=2789366 RepID=A0ACC1K950_9FUNG|nr:25S rRNA (adenine2142-N1)-methyltransferase [Coemansia nantahalensis]KAJ2775719.1 25S rRNA (adenine2142-N1)-methyltransferase [Coemansia nantahalensis]
MPKARARPRRHRPVTAEQSAAPGALALPPIHVDGQAKVVIDSAQLSSVPRAKLGRSSADTQRRISRFHTLIKEYSKLAARRPQLSDDGDIAALEAQVGAVEQEMAQMGGLDWYQKASLLGQSKQRGGDTSRWLVPQLRELGLDRRAQPLRLLDVGALSCLNYAKERSWIHATPIDLHAQEPGIVQQDFLDIAPGGAGDPATAHLFAAPFDVVCLSLVVNFVGDPVRRGDMLRQAARLLAPGGHAFLVLPRPCVDNSRYLDDDRLRAIMLHLGLEQVAAHHTAKLAHYLYRLSASAGAASGPRFKKKLLHSAPGRNNFSIVV